MNLPRIPSPGAPIPAMFGRRLIEYSRSSAPLSSSGAMTLRTPQGTLARAVPTVPMEPVARERRTWEIVIKGTSIGFLNCFYRRGPITVKIDDITGQAVTSTGQESWVAAEINTDAGTAEILFGDAWTDVVDQAVPNGVTSPRFRILLYRLVRPGTSGEWAPVDRLVEMPVCTLYV